MKILQCLSWLSSLWDQERKNYIEDDSSSIYLPYDIIANIFIRLPAESIVQCGKSKLFPPFKPTAHFVDLHIRRAEPMIGLQHYTFPRFSASEVQLHVDMSFTDDMGENITRKHLKIRKCFASGKKGCMPVIKGSYRGLLVFINVYDASILHIQNPVTKSQTIVVAPNLAYNLRGFYFHPASGEYRILCAYVEGLSFVEGICFEFRVLSLKTKSLRKISNSSHAPSSHKLPTVFNGVLHWVINDEDCDKVIRKSRHHCSNAIVIFNMDTEEFCTMPHPGGRCNLRTSHHRRMDLMECDGRLCLCDASSRRAIVVWILEDYTMQFWVKKHVVIIESLWMSCGTPIGSNYIQAVHIFGDDLLIGMYHSDVFLYNLSSGTLRRVGKKRTDVHSMVWPFVHVNSLVSMDIDDIVSLSP